MEQSAMLQILVYASLVHQSMAFLPSHASVTLPNRFDYTLSDLTVAGIVRAVARYFEDSNPDRYKTGDLTGLDPLTPSRLSQEHYGDCAYLTQFERAIDAITEENIRISNVFSHEAVWHFNGNQITNGNQQMIRIRNTLLDLLTEGDESAPDYDVARVYCGRFLHMMHSFYSNTNCIELNRFLQNRDRKDPDIIIPSRNLGINSSFTYLPCPSYINLCINCTGTADDLPEDQDCSSNLIETTFCMESGYRSGQGTKPVKKCSHGGVNDESRTTSAFGGINKETSDPRLSPHHFHHQQAALTALQATEDFFYHPETGLYKLIGEQKFRKLLNLDTGNSLTFVVDTTASMSDEIQAVKEEIIEVVNKHSGTCLAPSKYVIAPFNDPGIGPALVTTDPQDCIAFVDRLQAKGGGDCPELANSGLELGIQNSMDGNIVYVYTDAGDKDKEKLSDVLALVNEKRVKVVFLLTDTCPSTRRKRETGGSTLSPSYVTIASASGGEIYMTDNTGIRGLSRIVQGNIRASKVTITKRSSLNQDAFRVDIPVDSTVKEILVSIIGPLATDTVNILNPGGTEGTPREIGADVFTSSDQHTVFSVNTTASDTKGNWVINLQNLELTSEYRVTVSANSLLDFTFDFLEVDQLETAHPVDGLPVAGSEVLMLIKVSAPEMIRSISKIRLHDSTGQDTLFSSNAEPITGRTEGIYIANIILPDKPFIVSIVGVDTQEIAFLRTQPSVVQVVQFKLEQIPGNYTIEEIFPGGEGSFTFEVTNSGPDDSFTMSVSVGANRGPTGVTEQSTLKATVAPLSMELAMGESQQGVVTVVDTDNSTIGTSVKVTLTVSSSLASVLNIISVVATVIDFPVVIPVERDEIPPRCAVLDTGEGCTADQMSKDCHLHEWWVRFQAMDDTTMTEILLDPEVGPSQSLTYEEFSLRNSTSLYKATCCCPKLNITVKDGDGNSASCSQDYYTPVAGQIEEPVCHATIPIDPGLDTGAVIGIVVGCVVVVVLIIVVIIIFLKYFKGSNPKQKKLTGDPDEIEPSIPKTTKFGVH